MSAKEIRCILCRDYKHGGGKVCNRCMRRLYASHEWHQVAKEVRGIDRAIKELQEKKRQLRRSATVTWINKEKERRA